MDFFFTTLIIARKDAGERIKYGVAELKIH
jgi:hypothetical protein